MTPPLTCYGDGLVEPFNPGGYGAWGVVILRGSTVVERARGVLGWGQTNNVAEYRAAIETVKLGNRIAPNEPKALRSDSQLVIRQLSGEYAVRSERIRPHYTTLVDLLHPVRIGTGRTRDALWTLEWVPRELNELADHESREAVWDALGKWPLRGRFRNTRPDAPPTPRRQRIAAQQTLEGVLMWL